VALIDPKLEAMIRLRDTLQAAADRRKFHRMDFFEPYPKQAQFLRLGRTKRERLLMAGNQNGKTITGSYEAACHATGHYPAAWEGRVWERPTKGWAAGETGTVVRDVSQKYLLGEPGDIEALGTGMIPKEDILDLSLARGVTDAYDTAHIQHYTQGDKDGTSIIRFKSYEQGRTKFQADTIDWFWCDEEAPMDIYSEILTRTTATGGMGWMTFTPLKGRSDVVLRFTDEHDPSRETVTMTIEDAEHIPPSERAAIIAAWPVHEREARAKGVPMLGSGRIFQVSEDAIGEDTMEYIPPHWPKLWAIDFGIGHPFAAVLIAWDRDNDVIHVLHAFKIADQLPIMHAAQMKTIGRNVPVAWPHDGDSREKNNGEPLAKAYKDQKLRMLPEHATWPDGSISTEAGIMEMQQRFATGRLKVARHLSEWFGEYREYHRKDGVIVKERDDIMSATRIAVMAKRHAQLVQLGDRPIDRSREQIADGVDFDYFSQ